MYVDRPNMPQGHLAVAIVDGRINEHMEKTFSDMDIRLVKTRSHSGTYRAVSYHPDIMLHHLGGSQIIYAPGTDKELLLELKKLGFELIQGDTGIGDRYPGNIAYNVARIGRLAFHNTKYTDPVIKNFLQRLGVELVHVNQGYTKCSVSIVDENSIITSDEGIAKAAAARGIEVLLTHPDENILLPGLDKGFIGGSSGLIGRNLWAVAGKCQLLKSADSIKAFLTKKGINHVSLYDGPVFDIGSILPVMEK